MVSGQTVPFLPHILNLTFVHNEGAAFGLFPGRQPVFIATSCFVLFVIAAFWRRARPREWPVVIALAMVSAGAFGNLIDRALIGRVTDFFEFGFVEFPVFNIADMSIIGGVAILALWILFPSEASSGAQESCTDTSPDGGSETTDAEVADEATPIEDEVPW